MLVRRLLLEGELEEECIRCLWNLRIGLHIYPCIFTIQLRSPSPEPPCYGLSCALPAPWPS
jgi:hypothetical protein